MFEQFLQPSEYVDYNHPLVKYVAEGLLAHHPEEIDLIQATYYYVRDNIKHSWDAQDKRVTVSASDVLREGVGICWAKSNLLAALLRANGTPSGFSNQRLTLGDTVDTGYCIHTLNTVYVQSRKRWIRLDARGNKDGVDAQFDIYKEKLAFEIKSEGEVDYHDNQTSPDPKLMEVLKNSTDAIDMYLHHLPDTLSVTPVNRIGDSIVHIRGSRDYCVISFDNGLDLRLAGELEMSGFRIFRSAMKIPEEDIKRLQAMLDVDNRKEGYTHVTIG